MTHWKTLVKSTALAMAVAGTTLLGAGTAQAEVDWSWSWSGTLFAGSGIQGVPQVSGSGTIASTDNGDGSYTVTSITGTWDGYTIGTLDAANTYFGNDNLIFAVPLYVDNNGIAFTTTDGPANVNIFAGGGAALLNQGTRQDYGSIDSNGNSGPGTLTLSEIPEPASMTLLGIAITTLPLIRRRTRART